MNVTVEKHRYRPTEAQFKGKAVEMYVTYDLEQKTRGDKLALYPKVKRVYIAGEVQHWKVGQTKKRSGREVFGVVIDYLQSRSRYRRNEYSGMRGQTSYHVGPTFVKASSQTFRKIIDLPEKARNVHFYTDVRKLPDKYRQALQDVK